jgi:hypothetical protein
MIALLEAVAFLLELAALAAYAVWGNHVGGAALAVVLPVLVAALWGYALSPRARIRLPRRLKLGARVTVLLLSAAGLWAAGDHGWALALGIAVLVDSALLAILG